jgi:hypothetical protein
MSGGCVQGAVLHTPAEDQWQQVNWHRAETAAPVHYSRLTLPRHGRILCDQLSSPTGFGFLSKMLCNWHKYRVTPVISRRAHYMIRNESSSGVASR